jgi:glycosyltransferase involved in cell wall biosynthesis
MTKRSFSICHVTIGHSPTDDRIYYKEVLTLSKWFRHISLIAPNRGCPKPVAGIFLHLFNDNGNLKNLFHAYQLAKKVRADLYHIHEFEFLPFALVLKYKYGKKIIYDAHETIYFFFTEFSRHSKWFTFIPAVIAQALEWGCSLFTDYVIAVTPWVAKGFKPFHKKITLIYNYPIVPMFDQPVPKQVDQTGPIILYHGQLVPARNIHVMVEAMRHVKISFPAARLVIVGSITPHYREQLDQIVKRYNLKDVVEFRPLIPYTEVPRLISAATIGLSSMCPNESFKRSIQIKPFEFMSAGIPVLGCQVPSTEIYIEQTGSGMLVDPPTPKQLAEIIMLLLSKPELRQKMGANGKRAVREHYNWSTMEEPLEQIYRQVLRC